MINKFQAYAIAISVVAHLCAAIVIGQTSAARLSAAPPSVAPRYIKVDLINLPAKHAPKANEAPVVSLPKSLPPAPVHTTPPSSHSDYSESPTDAPLKPGNHIESSSNSATIRAAPGNPGGKLNIGSTSPGGDLPGNWDGGKTPIGWVPDPEDGPGKGSGHGPGVGTPEPKHADPGPNTRPAPASAPTPPSPTPAMVSIRVCADSGLLPGPNCGQTKIVTFVEGSEPRRICDKCQPPHKSRLADRAEPQLISDPRVVIPSSVPEGLSVRVEIQYTVTAEGNVTDVIILKSSGDKAIDRAVVSSALRMKYKPAIQDGVPRSVKKTRVYTINT